MIHILVVLFMALLGCAQVVHGQFLSPSLHLDLLAKEANNELKTAIFDENIFRTEELRIKSLKFSKYTRFMEDASEDFNQFLTNPINEYLLVKRIADWNQFFNDTKSKMELRRLPGTEEVKLSALGLLRLQVTFKLDTAQLAEGNLSGPGLALQSLHRYPMNAGECLEMGRYSYLIGEDDYALAWLTQSMRKYEMEEDKTAAIEDILQYSAYSSYKKGRIELAASLTDQLLKLLPQGRSQLVELYQKAETLRATSIESTGQEEHDENYKALCRGEQLMDQHERDRLFCSYTSSSSAYLKLQPVKQEVISLHPQIVIYHDIISDREIELIKRLALPKLRPVKATSAYNSKPVLNASLRRISNGTALNDTEHFVHFRTITRRLEELTGLHCSPARRLPLQVLTYGIGGHFSPHCDYTRNETLVLEEGDTLASLTLYLNDVEVGGSTVFPIAKAIVPPSKGSAAFWYNINPNGKGNPATLHASCPILRGYKWLAVQFYDTRGQELRRQCNFNYDSDETIRFH